MKREIVEDWRRGDPLYASRLNMLTRAARRAGNIEATAPLEVHTSEEVTFIHHQPHRRTFWPGVILATSSDFTDCRYRIRRQVVANSDADTSDTLYWEDFDGSDFDVVAQNLMESDAHEIPSDQVVLVLEEEDCSSPPNYRYTFIGRPQDFMAIIKSSASDNTGPVTRWKYTIQRAKKVASGYGSDAWGGYGASDLTAYNCAENINKTTGIQGNGIDVAHLDIPSDGVSDNDFYFVPLQPYTPVLVRAVPLVGSDNEFWIVGAGLPNGVDGVCPT